MKRNVDLSGSSLGANLRRLRRRRHLSPADVAAGTGLTVRTITDIEKGHRQRILEDTLLRLAKFFEMQPEELLAAPPRATRWRRWSAAAALALAVAIIVGWLWPKPQPWIQIDGNKLITENWSRAFPCSLYTAQPKHWAGRDDIIVNLSCSSAEEPSLQVLDAADGSTRWTVRDDMDELRRVFPDSLFRIGVFLVRDYNFADLWGDGEEELVVLARHNTWYPSYLATYDAGGQVLATYYHVGHLNDLLIRDIDADGREELLVTATSNVPGYGGGAFLVFDHEHLAGAAVDSLSQAGRFEDCELRDGSLRRLLFPSMPGDFLNAAGTRRLDGHHCFVSNNLNGDMEFSISLIAGSQHKAITVKTDAELNITDVIPCDPLRQINQDWFATGKVSRDYLTPEFLDDWAAHILRFEEGRLIPPQ